jgi:hypothetical protein
VAGAHDEWLSEHGRDPSVSVLAAVTEAVKGEWANYDANMQHWTAQKRKQHRERWRTLMDGPDGWAETEPLFASAVELCIWTIAS